MASPLAHVDRFTYVVRCERAKQAERSRQSCRRPSRPLKLSVVAISVCGHGGFIAPRCVLRKRLGGYATALFLFSLRTTTCRQIRTDGKWLSLMYEGRSMNKLQNVVFRLVFKISKIRNIRLVGNLFLYSRRNLYNYDVIIVTSLVLKAQSPCEIFSRAATATLLTLGVTSKNEHVKLMWVNFLSV